MGIPEEGRWYWNLSTERLARASHCDACHMLRTLRVGFPEHEFLEARLFDYLAGTPGRRRFQMSKLRTLDTEDIKW
jgi:hypothetical protein